MTAKKKMVRQSSPQITVGNWRNIFREKYSEFFCKSRSGIKTADYFDEDMVDFISRLLQAVVEDLAGEKEIENVRYGRTSAIEASAKIFQLGKRFNRLSIEKIVENKIAYEINQRRQEVLKKGKKWTKT